MSEFKLAGPDSDSTPLGKAQHTLNEGQERVKAGLIDFIKQPDDQFCLVKAPAGYGKTYTVGATVADLRGKFVFTAPTNKATKVLRDGFQARGERQDCRTIYSLLGLQLEPSGEIRELAKPEDPVDLSGVSAVFVDEGSMVNKLLYSFIREATELHGTKFIFLGDDAQLPPVKESGSPIWDIERKYELTQPMRNSSDIFQLATHIRRAVFSAAPSVDLKQWPDSKEIFLRNRNAWLEHIFECARRGDFQAINNTKAIAWRNKTVDQLNKQIRGVIFQEAYQREWLPGDRIVLAGPVKDVTDDKKKTVATTDDEGTVQRADIVPHPIYKEFQCWRLSVNLDDNRPVTIHLLHQQAQFAFKAKLEELAAIARVDRSKWRDFWAFKENFHEARHAYAITAHRSQGSTYQRCFVDYKDILINPQRKEAFQCFYVAASRAKGEVHLA